MAPRAVCWLWKVTCISPPKLPKEQRPLSTLRLRHEHIVRIGVSMKNKGLRGSSLDPKWQRDQLW